VFYITAVTEIILFQPLKRFCDYFSVFLGRHWTCWKIFMSCCARPLK